MMTRRSSYPVLALLGMVASTLACLIPDEPLSNNIPEKFSIFVQNPSIPRVHNYVMNFRANGDDEHLVLRPDGTPTSDVLYLDNGLLRYGRIHGVIDLEYNPADDTTKLFMTERNYHPSAIFQPVYGCDPDTDKLQIQLQLVSRLTDPPVLGGQIGIREVVGTYEFRYSPPANPLLDSKFLPVKMVIFRDGLSPTATGSTTSARPTTLSTSTTSSRSSSSGSTRSTTTTTGSTTPTNPAEFPPVGNYDFVSCWAEPSDGRTLPAAQTGADDMTLAKCAQFCSAYPYFGTQWGRECWCDSQLALGSASAPSSECNYPCAGDSTEICGGSRRLSLYHNDDLKGPTHPASVGDYKFHGCVTDSQAQRTLTGGLLRSPAMTLEMCATFCSGYTYFGAEWGTECWCGNSFSGGAAEVDASQCSMTCGGNSGQLCGKGDRLSVYQLAAA